MEDEETHYMVEYFIPSLQTRAMKLCHIRSSLWDVINTSDEVTCSLCNERMAKRVLEEL